MLQTSSTGVTAAAAPPWQPTTHPTQYMCVNDWQYTHLLQIKQEQRKQQHDSMMIAVKQFGKGERKKQQCRLHVKVSVSLGLTRQ